GLLPIQVLGDEGEVVGVVALLGAQDRRGPLELRSSLVAAIDRHVGAPKLYAGARFGGATRSVGEGLEDDLERGDQVDRRCAELDLAGDPLDLDDCERLRYGAASGLLEGVGAIEVGDALLEASSPARDAPAALQIVDELDVIDPVLALEDGDRGVDLRETSVDLAEGRPCGANVDLEIDDPWVRGAELLALVGELFGPGGVGRLG